MLRGVRRSVSLLVVVLSGVMGACAASPTDQFVTISDGRTLAYAIAREGDRGRVIFVHGSPAHAGSWNKLLRSQGDRLDGLEVVVVDRLGYGHSTHGTETSLEAQARAIEPLITQDAILVGHAHLEVPERFVTNTATGRQVLLG